MMDTGHRPTAVILAAGEGGRLRSTDRCEPKPLIELPGHTLAGHCVRGLSDAGIERFVAVVGYAADRVGAHFDELARRLDLDITTVHAPDWQGGNGTSALAARQATLGGPFLLTMVDHVLSGSLVRPLVASPPPSGDLALAVDRDRDSIFDLADLTKVQVDDGLVVAIGKDLAQWNGGDTGLFHCGPALFAGLERAHAAGDRSLTGGVRECIRAGRVHAVDVSGAFWIDVDTPEALAEAAQRLHERPAGDGAQDVAGTASAVSATLASWSIPPGGSHSQSGPRSARTRSS